MAAGEACAEPWEGFVEVVSLQLGLGGRVGVTLLGSLAGPCGQMEECADSWGSTRWPPSRTGKGHSGPSREQSWRCAGVVSGLPASLLWRLSGFCSLSPKGHTRGTPAELLWLHPGSRRHLCLSQMVTPGMSTCNEAESRRDFGYVLAAWGQVLLTRRDLGRREPGPQGF